MDKGATMNADYIRNLPAGRELDALVAEKLFGWQWWKWHTTGKADIFSPNYPPRDLSYWSPADFYTPRMIGWGNRSAGLSYYSTDRTACGAVIDWASDHGIYVSIYHCLDLDVTCKCWHHDNPERQTIASDPDESAAVCKAVLLCVAELDTP